MKQNIQIDEHKLSLHTVQGQKYSRHVFVCTENFHNEKNNEKLSQHILRTFNISFNIDIHQPSSVLMIAAWWIYVGQNINVLRLMLTQLFLILFNKIIKNRCISLTLPVTHL